MMMMINNYTFESCICRYYAISASKNPTFLVVEKIFHYFFSCLMFFFFFIFEFWNILMKIKSCFVCVYVCVNKPTNEKKCGIIKSQLEYTRTQIRNFIII